MPAGMPIASAMPAGASLFKGRRRRREGKSVRRRREETLKDSIPPSPNRGAQLDAKELQRDSTTVLLTGLRYEPEWENAIV